MILPSAHRGAGALEGQPTNKPDQHTTMKKEMPKCSSIGVRFIFPDRTIGEVDGNGNDLATRKTGVVVNLMMDPEDHRNPPRCAEVFDLATEGASFYTEIGLEWNESGTEVTGYDGAFELPLEVAAALRAIGIVVDDELL